MNKDMTNKKELNVNNKRFDIKSIIIYIVVIIFIGSLLFVLLNDKPKYTIIKSDFNIDYGKGKIIELSNIKEGISYKNNIKVTNDTDKDIVYSVSLIKVSNSFKEQNKLLYTIDTQDPGALFIGKSQLPMVDSVLSEKIEIKAKTTHSYTITVYFEGDSKQEKNSKFKGILNIKQVENNN